MLVEMIRASGSIEAAAANLGQPIASLEAAAAYYVEYPEEIDALIALNRTIVSLGPGPQGCRVSHATFGG